MGDGSSGSCEAEGESGEGFYVAQSGKRPNLLVSRGGYVQRGTCHKFTNVAPGGGWAKLFAVSQEIMLVEINGEVLKEEWRRAIFPPGKSDNKVPPPAI